METTGNQSQRPNETYAEYMDRLYRADPHANQIKLKETGQFGKSQSIYNPARPRWSFRVPHELAIKALKFMRAENMSITTYLTYAMHQLHTKNK